MPKDFKVGSYCTLNLPLYSYDIFLLIQRCWTAGTVKNDGGLAYPEIEYGEFWNNNGAAFLGTFKKHK